jgi:hypothetical protein
MSLFQKLFPPTPKDPILVALEKLLPNATIKASSTEYAFGLDIVVDFQPNKCYPKNELSLKYYGIGGFNVGIMRFWLEGKLIDSIYSSNSLHRQIIELVDKRFDLSLYTEAFQERYDQNKIDEANKKLELLKKYGE